VWGFRAILLVLGLAIMAALGAGTWL